MPKLNVYVSDSLAERIRNTNIAVSSVCQRALEQEVRRMEALRTASDVAINIVERLRMNESRPDSDDSMRESEGYEVGTRWARDVASSLELAALGGAGFHPGEQIPVDRSRQELYRLLSDAGLHTDSETNLVLSPSDPWGRGFLRACKDLWQQVEPLI